MNTIFTFETDDVADRATEILDSADIGYDRPLRGEEVLIAEAAGAADAFRFFIDNHLAFRAEVV